MSSTNGHRSPRRRAPITHPVLALLALSAALEGQEARRSVEPLLPVDTAFLWSVLEAAVSVCPALLTTATADQIATSLMRLRSAETL